MARRQPRYYHHGRSPAAWTGSIMAAIGFIVITPGAMMGPNWWIVGAGTALVVLAGIVTLVMKGLGYGQP